MRSPTSSPPPPEGNARYEAFCYHELVNAGGRPVVPLEFLSSGSRDAQTDREALAPWLGDTVSNDRDSDVPPVFSTQLEDWISFQQRWQWDNRGKVLDKGGFPAYLEWQRKMYLYRGEVDMVSDPSFEATTKRIWEHKPRSLELSRGEGFAAYARAVEKRLASHHFTQPFQLSEDPSRQDSWTTWVEYLNFVYWSRDRHVASMKGSEPQYRRAWEELESLDWSQSSATLSALKAKIQNIIRFLRSTEAYRRDEAAFHRQELRAQWVLEQLPLIETRVSEMAKNDVNGDTKKKRKRKGDEDDNKVRPQQKRTRRYVGHSNSVAEPSLTTQKRADAAMSSQGVATSAAPGFKPRRSQRRHVDDNIAKVE